MAKNKTSKMEEALAKAVNSKYMEDIEELATKQRNLEGMKVNFVLEKMGWKEVSRKLLKDAGERHHADQNEGKTPCSLDEA